MASSYPPGTQLPQTLDESDVEAELEVDQLDSDTDPEELPTFSKATSKSGGTRPGERVPGHTLLPSVRLENMIQADGVTGNLALSKEGLFVLAIATEEFIKRLIQAGHREASAHRRNQINYTDMAATTQQYQEFMCLCDTIPPQIPLAEALLLRREKEQEDLYADPVGMPAWPGPSVGPSPESEPMDAFPKPPKRSRLAVNGKERTNGSSFASASRKHDGVDLTADMRHRHPRAAPLEPEHINSYTPPETLEWVNAHDVDATSGLFPPGHPHHHPHRSGLNGISSASASSSLPPPPINGTLPVISRSQSPSYSREGSLGPGSLHSQPRDPDSQSHTPSYEPGWTGRRFTGPASGFLQSSVTAFGRAAPQNPGRTIYSQSHHPD